ncbi:MAG: hypothetical protein JSU63_16455 [Phycisphaerales bacterium]|nr:MAG: hypothetical protein JSU63_16455 [Phycisphaerales bacterium]
MSPRSLVDPRSGSFPYPWFGWESPPPESLIARRIQIHSDDIDPALNVSARYFVEGHYLAADDSEAGNADNNASYREILLDDDRGLSLEVDSDIPTQREQPEVRAWQDVDPTVVETDVRIPGYGMFILVGKAMDLGGGTWGYSYALQNLNSDRAGRSFTVRIPQGANVAGMAFHDVDHHSGEIYDTTDWSAAVSQECITWSTESHEQNQLANALRFDTLYSFYFEADAAPGPTRATMVLFKPGVYAEVQVDTVGPQLQLVDCNGNAVSDECDIDCAVPGCGTPCGTSNDCNTNGIPDECEWDCDGNGIADECDLADCRPGEFWCGDCNSNNVLDECERACYAIAVPAECSPAVEDDGDGVIDFCDLCPLTTRGYACNLAEPAQCCWPGKGEDTCIDAYPYRSCLPEGGIPELIEAPCRAGCLIGDADADGDFDLSDVASLHTCFSGDGTDPGHAAPASVCTESFDYDDDVDVDLADYTEFYELLRGP